MTKYTVDLSQDPKLQKRWSERWAVRAFKDALVYPWHLNIMRKRRIWRT